MVGRMVLWWLQLLQRDELKLSQFLVDLKLRDLKIHR